MIRDGERVNHTTLSGCCQPCPRETQIKPTIFERKWKLEGFPTGYNLIGNKAAIVSLVVEDVTRWPK